jgi:membrane-associated phospholipid phosphatase
VLYLYPHAKIASLSTIATTARWATGSCLPSLHIAFPFLYALVAARHQMRTEAWLLAAVTAATSVSVVYLGRHWITDVIAAAPFAFAVHWLVQRIDPRLTLSWESAGKGAE